MKELPFIKKHDYLVCVDSDGCLLDNMELKHKECFCPATVNIWNLRQYPSMPANARNLSISIPAAVAGTAFRRLYEPSTFFLREKK